jgi:methionyl-tRNA formyltransferase
MKASITLYLMTRKGWSSLKKVCEAGYHPLVEQVIVGEDKNIDNDFSKEIVSLCEQYGIAHAKRKDKVGVKSKYAIAISWRWLIDAGQTQLIVLHDSLLPKYKGFAPLVNYLINKEPFIGVTALFATENYDEGDVILQEKLAVEYPIKIDQAISSISELYSSIVVKLFAIISSGGEFAGTPQDPSEATYSLWRDEQDYFINWNWDAEKISRFIDAVGTPYKGARCYLDGIETTIHQSAVEEDVKIVNRDIGKVIFFRNERPVVVCGTGLLSIQQGTYAESGKSIFPLKKFRIRFT